MFVATCRSYPVAPADWFHVKVTELGTYPAPLLTGSIMEGTDGALTVDVVKEQLAPNDPHAPLPFVWLLPRTCQ